MPIQTEPRRIPVPRLTRVSNLRTLRRTRVWTNLRAAFGTAWESSSLSTGTATANTFYHHTDTATTCMLPSSGNGLRHPRSSARLFAIVPRGVPPLLSALVAPPSTRPQELLPITYTVLAARTSRTRSSCQTLVITGSFSLLSRSGLPLRNSGPVSRCS